MPLTAPVPGPSVTGVSPSSSSANEVAAAAPVPVGPGLWGRMVLAVAALFVVLAAGYSLLLVPALRRALVDEETEELEIFARLVAEHVELGIGAAFHELEDLAATPALVAGSREEVDPVLDHADARSHNFLFHYLVGLDGRILARPSLPERVGEDRLHAIRPAALGAARFASDVWITPLKHRTLTLSVPVRGAEDQPARVLTGVLGLMDRNQRVYRFITDPPEVAGNEVALVSPSGQVLATSRGASLGASGLVPAPLRAGISHVDEDGRHWVVASARVQSVGWWVVARVPEAVVQAELDEVTNRVAALVLPFLAAVFLGSVVVARRIVRRLEALTSAMSRYGREGRAEPVATGGRDEVAAAAAAFNRMLEDRQRARRVRAVLEERLRQAARMETVGRFATGVAHDMNNLLTPILSYAELLRAHAPAGSPEQEWAGEVVRVSERARDLVQQVLAYGRAAAPRREVAELGPLVEDTLRTFEGAAPRTITLARDLTPGVHVLGDPTQLRQVVLNLLTNAAQAIGPRAGRIDVHLGAEEGRARLTVRDTGPGLDAATLTRVFEPFFTTRGRETGTGLGLAIVQGIVAAHGGEVRVTSAPEHGATFEVLLPLDRGAPALGAGREPPRE